MEIRIPFQQLCQVQTQKLLLIMGTVVAIVVLPQLITFPYENYISNLSPPTKGKPIAVKTIFYPNTSTSTKTSLVHLGEKVVYEREGEMKDEDYDIVFDDDKDDDINCSFETEVDINSHHESTSMRSLCSDNSLTPKSVTVMENNSTKEKVVKLGDKVNKLEDEIIRASNLSSVSDGKQDLGNKHEDIEDIVSVTSKTKIVLGNSVMKEKRLKPTPISYMTSLLHTDVSANSMRPRSSSARDRELQHARLQIENGPTIRNTPGLHASIYRNLSMFIRSYTVMERMLKVYIYREGEKPIFHQPKLRGIYASEGWFMKLMEGNKMLTVRNPKNAHLFYLPFSSLKLRLMLHKQNLTSRKDLEKLLKNYIDSISRRYHFWNRTSGADHFLVACHDWAPRFTRNHMGSCIRAVCNSNLASGFKIGQDVTLPVTNIQTAENPSKYLGGNHPSNRPILAFFAGGMHGSLRPLLLKHWNNKEPDMKIFGQLSPDIKEGKTKYREFMKSSKYCICARGYEVHTPRVVESIYYECVPVIISDNYVPPFFEILDWEAFAVFVLEKDVPNLRNILLSIPEERYLEMQNRVQRLQQHFLWHKKPVKYDLFHMTLHSIWYNRVFSSKT